MPNIIANRRPSHEGHKSTAATLAKVAAVQEEIKKKSLDTESRPPPPPVPPRKDSRQQPCGISVMALSATNTVTAIQRISENGASPQIRSTNNQPPSQLPKPNRLKQGPRPQKSCSKVSPTLPSGSSGSSTTRMHRSKSSSPKMDFAPPLPPRPGTNKSMASSGEANLLNKVKEGRKHFQVDGIKAAKFIGKKSHEAWDKIKKQSRDRASGSYSYQPGGGPGSPASMRDTSNDIEVFGIDLKEAVMKTRIVKERKSGGDAAYWMPAIAYRCLQYLNVHGPHELGIYRISGSTSVVDELRADFKMKHDIDLFDNPPDDIHTVSSLLKGWFRSLPEAILPQDVQKRIYEKCKDETDATNPPKAFIEELSQLPPYNYYLLHHLFSHLSAICAASGVNKMNLANLGMIFCSTLRIDRFCFNWLVNSWNDCWAGCLTEEEEYERTTPKRSPANPSMLPRPTLPVSPVPSRSRTPNPPDEVTPGDERPECSRSGEDRPTDSRSQDPRPHNRRPPPPDIRTCDNSVQDGRPQDGRPVEMREGRGGLMRRPSNASRNHLENRSPNSLSRSTSRSTSRSRPERLGDAEREMRRDGSRPPSLRSRSPSTINSTQDSDQTSLKAVDSRPSIGSIKEERLVAHLPPIDPVSPMMPKAIVQGGQI
ncbi:hypothetical protein RUND412_004370 [Rhizina undulata]